MVGLETKPRTKTPTDQPVFVAGDGRRARRLRNVAIVAGLFAVLWVVGLAVGLVGFGSLPGVGLVHGVRADSRPDHAPRAVGAAESNAGRRHLAAEVILLRKGSTPSATAHRAAGRAAADQSR